MEEKIRVLCSKMNKILFVQDNRGAYFYFFIFFSHFIIIYYYILFTNVFHYSSFTLFSSFFSFINNSLFFSETKITIFHYLCVRVYDFTSSLRVLVGCPTACWLPLVCWPFRQVEESPWGIYLTCHLLKFVKVLRLTSSYVPDHHPRL